MTDRHQFRACWHNYNGGIYFVTICCADKRHYFGKIISDNTVGTRFIASALGSIVEENLQKIPSYYNDMEVWNYVVMPNHVHMILSIGNNNSEASDTNLGCLNPSRHDNPAPDFHHNSRLASIVGAFKAGVSRLWRTQKITSLPENTKIWQSRYHEHIIRDQQVYENIMNYINSNVENWCYDRFNANRIDTPVGTRLIASASADDTFNVNRIDNADAINRVPTTATDHEA